MKQKMAVALVSLLMTTVSFAGTLSQYAGNYQSKYFDLVILKNGNVRFISADLFGRFNGKELAIR